MSDKSLNIIANSAKMMADSARSMEMLMEDMETAISTQNSILGAFVDKLEDLIKKLHAVNAGGGGGEKGGNGLFSKLGVNKDTAAAVKGMAGSLPEFAKGMKDLGESMKMWQKIPESVAEGVGKSITAVANSLSKINADKVKDGGESLSVMAQGIAVFGLSLAASAILYLIGAAGSLVIIPILGLFAYTFSIIGRASDDIDAGAGAVARMGLAVAAFGLALWITKSLVGGDWASVAAASLVVVGSLALFGLAFGMIGQFADPIEKGARAVAFMGLAVIALGLGLSIFQSFNVGFGTVLVAAGAVAVIGIAFGLIGIFGSIIAEGALPIALAGLSLIVLALGLSAFRGIEKDDYVNAGAAILAVSGAMIVAGLGSIFIAAGAGALIVAGVALMVLSGGLILMNNVYQKAMFGILGPSDVKGMTNLDIVIGSLVNSFSINPIKSAFMLAGAAALIAVSFALITLSGGLLFMNSVYAKAVTGVLAPSDDKNYKTNLDLVISGVVDAFTINPIKSVMMLAGAVALTIASVALLTLAGGIFVFNKMWERTKSSSLFSASSVNPDVSNMQYVLDEIVDGMVMNPFKLAGLYSSVPAWIMAGVGLITIGTGLAKFVDIIEKKLDIDKVGDMVTSVLTTVATTLVEIGDGSVVDWDAVEEGISAVSNVGNVISGIAEGVSKMAQLKIPMYGKDGKITSYITIGNKEFEQVSKNMKMIIGAVVGTLVDIGASQGETGWFSKSAGEKGADAIRGIGQDLVGLADFVQKAANLTFPIYDKDGKEIGRKTIDPGMLEKGGSVYRNIVSMITSITSALAEIGSGDAASSGWFVDSDIEKGKEAISGISKDLNGIAQLVQSVATIKNFDEVDRNIRRTLVLMPQAMLGAAEVIEKNRAKLDLVSMYISRLTGPINDVVDVLVKVAEKKITEKDGEVIGNAMMSILSSFDRIKPDANYSNFQKAVEYIEKLAGTADPMEKLAKSFERISKSMGTFGTAFKGMNKDTLMNSNMLIQSLTTFSKADPNSLNALTDKGKMLIQYIYEKVKTPIVSAPTQPTQSPAPPTAQEGTKPVKVEPQKKTEQEKTNALDIAALNATMEMIVKKLSVLDEISEKLSGTLKVDGV